MSIEAKHAYRFGFLKSEQWQALRLACLARDDGKCRGCGKRDLSNDCHHIRYRENWRDTKFEDLRTLCRDCHKIVHAIMEEHPEYTWKQIKARINPPGMLPRMTGADYAMLHGIQTHLTNSEYQVYRSLTVRLHRAATCR